MIGLFKKNQKLVIMDGSSYGVVAQILCIVGVNAFPKGGKLYCRSLDENHPTMKVVEFECSKKRFNHIKNLIDEQYPGLCVYDVKVA